MPDGRLYLDPAVVLDGARNLRAAGTHVRNEHRSTGMALAADTAARPWGKDDIGAAFEKNYRPIEQQVLQAWSQLGEYLEGLGDAAAASVGDNQGADQEASVRVTRAYRERS
ncbi:MAG TPA: hypothetical protein VFH03_09165 [Actinoplanes sp.]|nr:hypothetical protein [Actinoplanes sp.]